MERWYSYKGEATWGEHDEGGRRVADRVIAWRVVARSVDEAQVEARRAVCGLDDPPPDRVRVLEVFELSPEEASIQRRSRLPLPEGVA